MSPVTVSQDWHLAASLDLILSAFLITSQSKSPLLSAIRQPFPAQTMQFLQSGASIQVMWSLSANQRPVFNQTFPAQMMQFLQDEETNDSEHSHHFKQHPYRSFNVNWIKIHFNIIIFAPLSN